MRVERAVRVCGVETGNDVLRTECVSALRVCCVRVCAMVVASCSGGLEGCSANKILSGPRIQDRKHRAIYERSTHLRKQL